MKAAIKLSLACSFTANCHCRARAVEVESTPNTVLAAEKDVADLIRNSFAEGVPFDEAKAFGSAALTQRQTMLADPPKEAPRPNIVVIGASGTAGPDDAVIKSFDRLRGVGGNS